MTNVLYAVVIVVTLVNANDGDVATVYTNGECKT